MTLGQIFTLFPILLIAISGYYFYLGRELSVWKRIASSAHGMFAIVIPPMGLICDELLLERGSEYAGIGFLSLFLVALVSVMYSMVNLKVKWRVHLLHIITIGGLFVVTSMTGFMIFDGIN